MKPIETMAGLSAQEIERRIFQMLGEGSFILIWGAEPEVEGEKPRIAMLSNMVPEARIHAITSYILEEFKDGAPGALADVFEISATGALASLFKDRASARLDELMSAVAGGRGNAN